MPSSMACIGSSITRGETVSDRNLERIKALGGGIAIQHRMAYQGEYFIKRYGAETAARTPPVTRMLELGIPVGAGSDATRVASYNPFVCLYWLTAGKTVGGTALYPEANRLSREDALKLYTIGAAGFPTRRERKARSPPGQLADLAVLSDDFFSAREDDIQHLESVLTVVGGKPVYATAEFKDLDPPPLPISPDWSPVRSYGGYGAPLLAKGPAENASPRSVCSTHGHGGQTSCDDSHALWGALGCDCFVF